MRKKLLSIILCFITVLTTVSVGFVNFPVSAASPIVSVLYGGKEIDELSVLETEKKAVDAECTYDGEYSVQWQILADINDELWVNIQGQNEEKLEVSKALVKSAAENGSAYIRACVKAGEAVYYSEPVCVTIEEAQSFAYASDNEKSAPKKNARAVSEAPDKADGGEAIDDDNVYVIINYLDADKKTPVFAKWSSQLKTEDGFELHQTVLTPQWLGFTPYYCEENTSTMNPDDAKTVANEIKIDLGNEHTQNVVYNIFYKPALVPYGAKFMYQNIYDDMYTEDTSRYQTGKAYTGTYVDDKQFNEWGDKEGFTALYHFPETVAANGSTVFECYYDRNYYLLKFDMDGGYGTEPIYAKYETPFFANDPTKAGYVFEGWDLCTAEYPNGDGKADAVPDTIPSKECSYKALWKKVKSSYTTIYWAENPNDDKYSFWGYRKDESVYSEDIAKVNRDPAGAQMINPDEIKYFTYNPAKSDKTVIVKGDGSTIANVYFTRNRYNVVFYDRLTGSRDNLCGYEEHTHSESCYDFVCDLPEHSHKDEGCKLVCTIPAHTHDATCPTANCKHVCGPECYGATSMPPVAKTSDPGYDAANNANKRDGYVYRVRTGSRNNYQYHNFFYLNGTLYYLGENDTTGRNIDINQYGIIYRYNSNPNNTNALQCNTAPTHKCTHVHTEDCYSCGKDTHIHDGNCYSCGQIEHTHTHEECYVLKCGKKEHTHTNNCKIGSLVSESNGSSSSHGTVNDARVLYTINAKYQEDISEKWPQSKDYTDPSTGYQLDYWCIYPPEWDGYKQGTKIVTMTPELCNEGSSAQITNGTTIVFAKYMTRDSNNTKRDWTVAYFFESTDQTAPANGTTRVWHDGYKKYYDIAPAYTQTLYGSNGEWGLKAIDGMDKIADDKPQNPNPKYYDENKNLVSSVASTAYYNKKVYAQFFYNRKEYEVSFYNYDSDVEDRRVTRKYGASIKDLNFEPVYPDTLEKSAYYFDGWYTSPECIEGTECDFDTQTVPMNGITLYAKWSPVNHHVRFFLSEDIMNAYYAGEQIDGEDADVYKDFSNVPHGNNVGSVDHPSNVGAVVFKGWFYYENGIKKQIVPENHPVVRNMDIFAEWGSNVAQPYIVHYVLLDNENVDPSTFTDEERRKLTKVAEDTHGYAYEGSTKTFTAKAGDPFFQLYDEYNTGVYPTYASTSIVMRDVEDKNNPIENEAWFYYVKHVPVPYLVRYLDAKTGEELLTDKVYPDNVHGVITERFQPIENYVPDKIYKRLVLQYDKHDYDPNVGFTEDDPQQNVVIFYYTQNYDLSPYVVHHMFQNKGTDETKYNIFEGGVLQDGAYFEYTKTEGTTDLNSIDINPITVNGYETVEEHALLINTIDPSTQEKQQVISAQVDGSFELKLSSKGHGYGTELYIYYTLKEYPYKVQYLEYGTTDHKIIEDKDYDETYDYGTVITESYVDLEDENWTLMSPPEQTLTITDDPERNVIVFYYRKQSFTVQYQPWYNGGGDVSLEIETISTGGSFIGSVPTASSGYKFDGWYRDKECEKEPVDSSWIDSENRITPDISGIDKTDGKNNIFYAKFTPLFGGLTIDRNNAENEGNGEQVFVYKVTNNDTGSVITVTVTGNGQTTITDLPAGKYTVEQVRDWSWRFDDDSKTVTVEAGGSETVTFDKDAAKPYWLSGNSKLLKNIKGKGAK